MDSNITLTWCKLQIYIIRFLIMHKWLTFLQHLTIIRKHIHKICNPADSIGPFSASFPPFTARFMLPFNVTEVTTRLYISTYIPFTLHSRYLSPLQQSLETESICWCLEFEQVPDLECSIVADLCHLLSSNWLNSIFGHPKGLSHASCNQDNKHPRSATDSNSTMSCSYKSSST